MPVAVSFQGALRKVLLKLVSLHGKWSPNISTIIFTFPFSSRGSGKPKNLINFWPVKALTNSSKKVPTNSSPFSRNSSSPSKVTLLQVRSSFNEGPRGYVCGLKENPETSTCGRNDRLSFGAILQTNTASIQHVQKQKM